MSWVKRVLSRVKRVLSWVKRALFDYDYVIALLLIGIGIWRWGVVGGDPGWRIMLAFSSGGAAFLYFAQKQKLEEARLLKELITEFNRRYDTLNERLAKITATTPTPLSTCQKEVVIDYFNLCAEEYLFYTLDYVPPRVWDAWQAGMKVYRQDDRIKALWQEEEKKNKDSYYGFDFLKE